MNFVRETERPRWKGQKENTKDRFFHLKCYTNLHKHRHQIVHLHVLGIAFYPIPIFGFVSGMVAAPYPTTPDPGSRSLAMGKSQPGISCESCEGKGR